MDDFKSQVKQGFLACKEDISSLYEENENLNKRLNLIEKENKELKEQIFNLSSQIKGLEIAMNYIKNFNSNSTNSKSNTNSINNSNTKQDPYEALLAFKAKSNKRELLKQKLISMITETGINLSELKFLFVDHYKYCSKATFYNYIRELEFEKYIIQKRENNKSFVYLLNSIQDQFNS